MKPIKPDVANLSVTTHGSVFWNDERMGDEQLAQRLQASGLPVVPVEALRDIAAGQATKPPAGIPSCGRVVAFVEYRDGTVIDVVRAVQG